MEDKKKHRVIGWMETWAKFICPECAATNWVCFGNLDDLTGTDVDAAKCHRCKKVSLVLELEDLSEDPEDWYIENGTKQPR
jgi:hypothetical protein